MLAPRVPMANVIAILAFEVGRTADELLARDQRFWPAWRRAALVWLGRRVAGQPLSAIAATLGRDTSTVWAALRQAEVLRLTDEDFRALTDRLAPIIDTERDYVAC